MNDDFDPTYAGARALNVLINREKILTDIKREADDESQSTRVFYITAPGGMGKTFLIRQVLSRFQPGGAWYRPDILAAHHEVDFYHSDNHTVEGATWSLYKALGSPASEFTAYLEQRARWQQAKLDLREALRDLDNSRLHLIHKFQSDLHRLTVDRRGIVIAFDTTEKIQYESDRVQRLLKLEEDSSAEGGIEELRTWLFNLLAQLPNAVILVAGRPHERLQQDLRTKLGDRLIEPELREFREQDTLQYFEEIAALSDEIKQRLSAIPEDTRRVIHLYTGGRPILLALTIDYLVASQQLLPDLLVPYEEARATAEDPARLEQIQHHLEVDIVRSLQELGRSSDDVIRSLAWTPKGMDAELLHRITGMSPENAQAGLNSVTQMSFVKVRRGEDSETARVFLHDEMYDLLKRHVLDCLPEAQSAQVHQAIKSYYSDKIKDVRERISQLEREGRGQITADRQAVWDDRFKNQKSLEKLSQAELALEKLLVEDVYYSLRHQAKDGFNLYRDYADMAFESNDFTLDMQLRDELLAFVNTLPADYTEHEHMERHVVDLDSALRWIKRYLVTARYDKAHALAGQIRQKSPELLVKPAARPELDIWDSWALVYSAQDLKRAESMLHTALNELEADKEIKKAAILLARGHNILGFLMRSFGRFHDAIKHYVEATSLWDDLDDRFCAEYANTLNNLAWARTEVGDFQQAILDCRRALELRRELGPLYPVALSHNTMGMIQTRAGNPADGRIHCEHALYIFRELNMPRGVGLAEIALAEALRRSGTNDLTLYYPEQSISLLRQARAFAIDAVNIFAKEAPEPIRQIEALRELGCIYRDWAWLRNKASSPIDNDPQSDTYNPAREVLAELGRDTLNQAARLAREKTVSYLEIDASVNLAWLYFYLDQFEDARRAIAEARAIAPPAYHLMPDTRYRKPPKATSWFWVQLGKVTVLEGNIAMQEFLASRDVGKLQQAGQSYTLALAYDDLFSPNFRDRKRAEEEIQQHLTNLRPEELDRLHEVIAETAGAYRLKPPVAMQKVLERRRPKRADHSTRAAKR